jgi:sulfatase maturation enzyme AslB (radical SAM superfamily)
MIRDNRERNTAVMYTCGTCNLNCRYCGIDKNPILAEIDKVLAKSFEGDYYFNRFKEYFPNKGQLKRIETWGGEPFLHMDRIYNLLNQVIDYYPYFDEMYSSTNFSYPEWTDQVFGLFEQFGKYPYRDFHYTLQLSVDGPEYINDANRGKGVTQKCLANFEKLLSELEKRLPKNVFLDITIKATLDNENIRQLCSKEKLIEYYQFFEEEFQVRADTIKLPNVHFYNACPNTAVPSPVTVEEGKIFAEFCRLCREIERENIKKRYFKYYTEITPFTSDICQDCLTHRYSHHTCGAGTNMIGFLPDNMLSTCHEGFTFFIEEYKKLAANSENREKNSTITFNKFLNDDNDTDSTIRQYCVDDDGYAVFEEKMAHYTKEGTTARLASIASLISCLAMAGQIKSCYIDPENALKAAIFIQSHTSYCIKDNYNKTGTITNVPVGLLKLLLNGAMEYIQYEGELKVDECE